jgi:hypothetical protein
LSLLFISFKGRLQQGPLPFLSPNLALLAIFAALQKLFSEILELINYPSVKIIAVQGGIAMSIIIENQTVTAGVRISGGALSIEFTDDPSFVRSESVIVDLMQRNIGLIFQNGYHFIGDLPDGFGDSEIDIHARLSGHGAGGKEIHLNAPIKIVGNA